MTNLGFKPLRYRGPNAVDDVDTADPDWHALQIPPNSALYTVASAENGAFAINVSRTSGGTVRATSGYTHAAAETDAETAEEIADAINADIAAGTAGTLADYAVRAIYVSASATFYVQWKTGIGEFFVSTTDPGSATLTALGGVRFPQVASIPFGKRLGIEAATDVEMCVVALDSSGDPLIPASGTFTAEVIEAFTIGDPADNNWIVLSRGEVTAAFNAVFGVQCNGSSQFGLRFSVITEPASTDQIVVYYRAVVA